MKKILSTMIIITMFASGTLFAEPFRKDFDEREFKQEFQGKWNKRPKFEKNFNFRQQIIDKIPESKREDFKKIMEKYRSENEKYILEVKAKDIEIQKLMLEKNIDWNKIEKILNEKANYKVKLELNRLKMKNELTTLLGYDFPHLKMMKNFK